MSAGVYSVLQDFGDGADPTDLSSDPYWVVAVMRLGLPLSFSRAQMASVTKDLTQGALLRAEAPLVITDDCVQGQISGQKGGHTKSMNLSLKQTDVNYLVELQPGDWTMCWLVNNRAARDSLLSRIARGEACNKFDDGLKFVGRIHNIRKLGDTDPGSGTKTAAYSVQAVGFSELDTQFFYDNSLASKDVLARDYGQWLTRIGIEVEALFGQIDQDVQKDNINRIIPTLLDLIVGRGPSKQSSIIVDAATAGQTVQADPSNLKEAPYSYVIPVMVAKLLGKTASDASKPASVLGYSDILELVQGVQNYSNRSGSQVFTPDLSSDSTPQRRITPTPMSGTFLPFFPEFTNKPLWSVFQQYLNPTINEMYTALRVNSDGNVVPTIVLRQIPFTTNAFQPSDSTIRFTRFLSLPRWQLPPVMVQRYDIGRSDATRINFVHVYGSSSYQTNAVAIQEQMVNSPPVKDDVDIIRSGLRPYMTTVECWVDDTVGKVQGDWMKLIADWTMGSHLTLNGSIESFGVQSPICEGDNLEFDGVVFHIEGVSHSFGISTESGDKHWRTSLSVTNGMRADTDDNTDFPIYPGFDAADNTAFDPGLSLDQVGTTGGDSSFQSDDTVGGPTQLDPAVQAGDAGISSNKVA